MLVWDVMKKDVSALIVTVIIASIIDENERQWYGAQLRDAGIHIYS
jgi:hypothetical protein